MDSYIWLYRRLIRLYPRSFRDHYGEPLVQHFVDLAADRGLRSALTRTGLDLVITVPRYRMESLMSERHTSQVLTATIWTLAGAGALSIFAGLYPGMLFLVAAAALAVAQRGALGRSLRTPDSDLRRRRLRVAAVSGAIFIATFAVYLAVIGDTWTTRETALAIVGYPAMVCSIGYLITGLLTPKTPTTRQSST